MTARKTTRSDAAETRRSTLKPLPEVQMRRWSALIGGVLICAAIAWFAWLLSGQHTPSLTSVRFPFLGPQAQSTSQAGVDPLEAAGITLSTPTQTPLLNEQQGRVLADQMEPQAAAHARSVSAKYVLFNYKSGTATGLHNVPAWLFHYINVAGPAPDTAADPHASNATHDCYFFLDANSGQELLALWS